MEEIEHTGTSDLEEHEAVDITLKEFIFSALISKPIRWASFRMMHLKIQSIRFLRALLHVDYVVVIDKMFRFLQLLIIASIISTLFKAVNMLLGSFLEIFLSISAAFYLGIPISRWAIASGSASARNNSHKILYSISMAALFSVATLSATSSLSILLRSAVNFDTNRAREDYQEHMQARREQACLRAHQFQRRERAAEECLEH